MYRERERERYRSGGIGATQRDPDPVIAFDEVKFEVVV